MGIIGTSLLLIITNMIFIFSIISDLMFFKGIISIGGIAKIIFGIGLVIMGINSMFEEIFKSYDSNISRKIIYITFIKSPVFYWWLFMLIYFFSVKLLRYYITFETFIIIYLCLCILIFYFQKLYLKKLQIIKDKMVNGSENE